MTDWEKKNKSIRKFKCVKIFLVEVAEVGNCMFVIERKIKIHRMFLDTGCVGTGITCVFY